jgi:hypothetical protein
VVLSRQLESLTRQYSRNQLEVRQAVLWGHGPVMLGELEFQILQSLDGGKPVPVLVDEARSGVEAESVPGEIRRLAEHGVVDLVPSPS